MYFRRGSLNAKNGGEYGELGARKGVSVKAESRGLSLERRNFSRTKVYEAPGEVPHASNLGTRGDRVRGISRFQTSQGYIVRRYLKKKKKTKEAHVALVCGWSEEANFAGKNAGRPGLVSVRGDALRARVPAQLSSLAPIGCS